MDARSFELAGVVWQSPVTAGTNLVLSGMCFGFYARLCRALDRRTVMWRRFLLALGVATLAGVPKHALKDYAAASGLSAVVLLSCMSVGIATYYAQRATLESGLFGRDPRGLLALVRLQLVAFIPLMLYRRLFSVALLQMGLGLGGVLFVEVAAYLRGHVARAWTLAGIAVAILPGWVYLLRWPSSVWFDHNDLAHVLMAASLVLVYRGARAGSRLVATL